MNRVVKLSLAATLAIFTTARTAMAGPWAAFGGKFGGDGQDPSTWNDNNIFLTNKFHVPTSAYSALSAAVESNTNSNSSSVSNMTFGQLSRNYAGTMTCSLTIDWYRPTNRQSWIRRHFFNCEYPTGYRSNGTVSKGTYYGKLKNGTAQVFRSCR